MRVRNPLRAIPVCLGGHFSPVYEPEEGDYCPLSAEMAAANVSHLAVTLWSLGQQGRPPLLRLLLPSCFARRITNLYPASTRLSPLPALWHCVTLRSVALTIRSFMLPTNNIHIHHPHQHPQPTPPMSLRSFSFIHESVSSSFFTAALWYHYRFAPLSLSLSALCICMCVFVCVYMSVCLCSPALG